MKLTADTVNKIFMDCLFKDEEVDGEIPEHIKAEGIMLKVGFHPERLEGHRDEVIALLDELPDTFKASVGGGMSFLNACEDKHGSHWGEHEHMDKLFMLGMGIKKAKCLMPKEMWKALPGGMPYYAVLDKEYEEPEKV